MRKSPRPPKPPDPPKIESEVKTAVEQWLAERNLKGRDLMGYGWEAIATLSKKKCSAEDIVDVLELLWLYGQTKKFARKKESRERWLTRAKNLVQSLREDADEAEALLQFIAGSPRTTSTSTSATSQSVSTRPSISQTPLPKNKIASDDDSDDDSDSQPPALETEVGSSRQSPSPGTEVQSEADTMLDGELLDADDELELWEIMRKYADDLEAYLSSVQDKDLPLEEQFKRKFAGTTGTIVWLAAAAAFLEKTTGEKELYKEISALLVVCPDEKLSHQTKRAVQLRVERFRERNPEFVEDYLTMDRVKESVRRLRGDSQRPRSQ